MEPYDGYYTRSELEAMKAEAARVERERCARACDDIKLMLEQSEPTRAQAIGARVCAAAIRKGE